MKQISAFALNNQAQIFSTLFLVWIEFQTIWSIFLIFMQISLDYTPPPPDTQLPPDTPRVKSPVDVDII